jgi:xylogalacturonan beta-1,3-xylosyltransferase
MDIKCFRQTTTVIPDVTASSRFTLCPRGYDKATYRLYEAMQLGSVPVYISDHHVLPLADELDWEEFCVIVDAGQVSNIDRILTRITD